MPDPEPAGETLFAETCRVTPDASGVEAIHAALDRAWRAMDDALACPPDPLWRMLFATAAGEIAANIITHAGAGTATLALCLRPDRLTAIFRDHGAPYVAPPALEADDLDAPDEMDALSEHGRGIDLARAALDTLTYTRTPPGENIWTLEKRFAPSP
jgi:anti-sigma regulatory factor (Ser/Thr protein kinase)